MTQDKQPEALPQLRDDPGYQQATAVANEVSKQLAEAEARFSELSGAARAQQETQGQAAIDRAINLLKASPQPHAQELRELRDRIGTLKQARSDAYRAVSDAERAFAEQLALAMLPSYLLKLKQLRAHYGAIVELDQAHRVAMSPMYAAGGYEVGPLRALIVPDEVDHAGRMLGELTERIHAVQRWIDAEARSTSSTKP